MLAGAKIKANTKEVFYCKFGCSARASSEANLRQHYKRVRDAIAKGTAPQNNCPGKFCPPCAPVA